MDEMVHVDDHEMVGLITDREESTAHNSGTPYLWNKRVVQWQKYMAGLAAQTMIQKR